MAIAPVLIVDDDVAARAVYGLALAHEHFAPVFASSEQEALRHLYVAKDRDVPIQVAFVALALDGIGVLEQIWDIDPDVEVVLSVSTLDGDWEAEIEDLDAGGRYLVARKPHVPSELRQLAHAQADAWRLRQMMQSHVWDLELQHANRMHAVSQLAAGMAHEINTPIQYLSDSVAHLDHAQRSLFQLVGQLKDTIHRTGDSRLVLEATQALNNADYAWLKQEGPQTLRRMRDGHRRIAEVVSSLRQFADIDSGARMTDLNAEVLQALHVAEAIYKPVADVRLDFADSHAVRCAPRDMRHVFLQLISNAAGAIRERGDVRGEIFIETRYLAGWASVSFRDNGTGIHKNHQDGLAICQDIVSRHGGGITFDAEPGRGSTFNIQVPMEVAS